MDVNYIKTVKRNKTKKKRKNTLFAIKHCPTSIAHDPISNREIRHTKKKKEKKRKKKKNKNLRSEIQRRLETNLTSNFRPCNERSG